MAEKIMSSIINAFIDIALRRDFAFFHYIFYNFYFTIINKFLGEKKLS